MNESMTYEQLVEECKRLRLKAERSESEFFAFLMVAERKHQEIWQAAGCNTFEQFIRSHQLCKFERYHFFALGVDRAGLDSALANGAHWTIQAGKMMEPSKETMQEFAKRAADFIEMQNTAPAEETVRDWAKEINADGREPHKRQQVSELHRLRAEVVELRAKLRHVERENEDLRAKLQKVEKGKQSKKPQPPQPQV